MISKKKTGIQQWLESPGRRTKWHIFCPAKIEMKLQALELLPVKRSYRSAHSLVIKIFPRMHFSLFYHYQKSIFQLAGPPRKVAEPSRQLAGTHRKVAEPSRQLAGTLRKVAEPSRQLAGPPRKVAEPSPQLAGTPRKVAEPSPQLAGTPRKVAEPSPQLAGTPRKVAEPSRIIFWNHLHTYQPQFLKNKQTFFRNVEHSRTLSAFFPIDIYKKSKKLDHHSISEIIYISKELHHTALDLVTKKIKKGENQIDIEKIETTITQNISRCLGQTMEKTINQHFEKYLVFNSRETSELTENIYSHLLNRMVLEKERLVY